MRFLKKQLSQLSLSRVPRLLCEILFTTDGLMHLYLGFLTTEQCFLVMKAPLCLRETGPLPEVNSTGV